MLLAATVCWTAIVAQVPGPRVALRTPLGTLTGNKLHGSNEFLGFPFATADRFAAPEMWIKKYPADPFDATYFGPACLQVLTQNTTYGKEDCLVMNVWQPQRTEKTAKLPVLLWVFGGENDFGEAEPYNASTLAAKHNAVVCSFNYRVGPFGFLAFDDEIKAGRSSGNYALQDIQMAMRWVQKFVHLFGGDKHKVALFGQSSGAGNVQLQTVIPTNAGLLRGAISESGGLSADPLPRALNNTATVAARVNCTKRGYRLPEEALECLRATKADDIIFAQQAVCKTPNDCSGLSFGPVVDGVFVPDDPAKLLEQGKVVGGVGVLYGAQTNDSNFEVQNRYTNESGYPERVNASRYTQLLAAYIGAEGAGAGAATGEEGGRLLSGGGGGDGVGTANANANGNGNGSSLLRRALELYPPSHSTHESAEWQANIDSIGWYESDKFLCAIRRNLRLYARAAEKQKQKQKQFLYRFNYWFQSNTTCTAESNYHGPALGATHQDEVTFVFGRPIFMNVGYSNCSTPGWSGFDPTCLGCEFDAKEASFALDVGRYWTNFASSGDPNVRDDGDGSGTGDSEGDGKGKEERTVVWPAYSEAEDMSIVLEPRIHTEKATGRKRACDFWDSVPPKKK